MNSPMAGRGAQQMEGLGMCPRKCLPSFRLSVRDPLWGRGRGGSRLGPRALAKAPGALVESEGALTL